MLEKLAVGEIVVGEVVTGEIVLGKLSWGNDLTPLNTSKEFMKCRLDNFSMGFILFYVNLSICENK